MEVVPIRLSGDNNPNSSVGLPFSRRNVEEWSRIDRLTGMMETAKIETDHWTARSNNAAHNYGKIRDSRERNNPDGSLQERQRKQMEVFQTKIPGGSMQVIRTQTITTSSRKWSSAGEKAFEDLELPVNSLDLSSQKTKGSVGRSGSIGGRRPPSRPRSLINQSSNTSAFEEESPAFQFYQHLHQQAREEMYKDISNFANRSHSFNGSTKDSDAESDRSGVVITDVTNLSPSESFTKNNLTRQKSCSNENLAVDSNTESLLRRSSKVRRSLQCHKPSYGNVDGDTADEFEVSPTKSLKERAAEIEKLLRHGSSTYMSPNSDRPSESFGKVKFLKTKDSFISAETLKEVRDRLKKPNLSDNELKDDGIVTEKNDYGVYSKLNNFENDMQSVNCVNKKPNINGTGSLESRYSNKNSANGSRTSEWYRRRKSYGFEQVDEYEKFDKFNKKKNHMDSSTDSGICQSSETMGIPSWNKNLEPTWSKISPESTMSVKKDPVSATVTVRVKKDAADTFSHSVTSQTSNHSFDKAVNSVYLDGHGVDAFLTDKEDFKKIDNKKAVFKHNYNNESLPGESVWNKKSPIPFYKTSETRENLKSSLRSAKNPWISQLRGTKLVDRNWISDEQGDLEENKFKSDNLDKPPIIFHGKEDGKKIDADTTNPKKNKKVEFCKTEVHFAAESGKFNIVETDGKPPPNDIFRKRRRSTGSTNFSKELNSLPETKFGDSTLEKNMLTTSENVNSISEKIEAELNELSRIVIEALPQSKKPETDNFARKNSSHSWLYNVAEEPVENSQADNAKPRSILKNYGNATAPIENEFKNSKVPETIESRQRSPISDAIPVWQSTVILRNKRYDDTKGKEEEKKLYSSDGESELQTHIRNLRKIDSDQKKLWESSSFSCIDRKSDSKRRSLPDDIFLKNSINIIQNNISKMSISTDEMPSLSVAERVKQVEQLKSNNYSTKINFRSGEVTVVQNGTSNTEEPRFEEKKKIMTSWANQRKLASLSDSKPDDKKLPGDRTLLSCDELTSSNPPVMRFSAHDDKTDNQKYQTTRILINFKTSAKDETKRTEVFSTEKINKNNNNKTSGKLINTYGSWSSGMKKDLGRYLNDLKSTSLVRETIHPPPDNPELQPREDIPKPSKPVHEIIDQFDSLSLPNRKFKEKRRKPIPVSYKISKEYTHSDLEEELKNFTENLDKDFRDIYEEEIGSYRNSKNSKESRLNCESPPKIDTAVRPIILNRSANYFSAKSSSDEGSKKSSLRTSSRDNYDTDDSDLLADEEVRSYMSTGHGGSESETEGAYGTSGSRKSFEDSILRFKKLESQTKEGKEIKSTAESIHTSTAYPKSDSINKLQELNREPIKSQKIASIALKYEDDPLFSKRTYENIVKPKSFVVNQSSNELNTEPLDRTTNSSSAMNSKPRERVSYLNGLSLSEKYSKYLQKSSHSHSDTIHDCTIQRKPRISGTLLNETEDYLPKSKSESEKPSYKLKLPHQNYHNGTAVNELRKTQKEEKIIKEKSSHMKHSRNLEHLESSRLRVKPNLEKPSSHKSMVDKYSAQDYRTEKSRQKERNQTDGELEELKRAADEIIMAVNGYTDDSSIVGSSEEDRPRRIIRKDRVGNLGTISEGKRVTKTESRKSTSTNLNTRMAGNQSSASSIESLTKESIRPIRELKSSVRHRHGENSKSSSQRSSRLLQRATSREAIIGQPSSSEDIPSYLEQAKRRVVRRQKSGSSTKSEVTSDNKAASSSRHKSKTKTTKSSLTASTRNSKPEKLKETPTMMRSSRSIQAPEVEKTKSSSRKTHTEKSEIENIRKRRCQRTASREEHASTQTNFQLRDSDKAGLLMA